MKKWLEKLFRNENPPLDYIVADYKPEQLNRLRPDFKQEEMHMYSDYSSHDEMDVDNLYRH